MKRWGWRVRTGNDGRAVLYGSPPVLLLLSLEDDGNDPISRPLTTKGNYTPGEWHDFHAPPPLLTPIERFGIHRIAVRKFVVARFSWCMNSGYRILRNKMYM